MDKACSSNGGEKELIYVIGGKTEGKKPLGRPRGRWVDSIKNGVVWTGLVRKKDREIWVALVKAIMNLWVP
jgi:hypothetical protein